jgi:hypothetical protein
MCGDVGFSNREYEITLRRPPSMDYGLDRFLFSIFFSYFLFLGWVILVLFAKDQVDVSSVHVSPLC